MDNYTGLASDALEKLGQNFLIAYYLPAALFMLAHVYILVPAWNGVPPPPLMADFDLAKLIGTLLLPLLLAIVLRGLNGLLIRSFEGKLPWLKNGLLAPWTRRNRKGSAARYGKLIELQRDYQKLALSIHESDQPSPQEQAKLVTLIKEIEEEYKKIKPEKPPQTLPYNPDRIGPTLFGNLYAVAEEYAYERYGIDSVLFWPRLRGLLYDADATHAERLTQQKTFLDLAVNLTFMSGLVALGSVITLAVWGYRPLLLVLLILAVILAVSFHYASVGAVRMLGELIKISYDFHRGLILDKFNLKKPDNLALEKLLWVRLAAFIKRGDDFYFPAAFQESSGKEEDEDLPESQ